MATNGCVGRATSYKDGRKGDYRQCEDSFHNGAKSQPRLNTRAFVLLSSDMFARRLQLQLVGALPASRRIQWYIISSRGKSAPTRIP